MIAWPGLSRFFSKDIIQAPRRVMPASLFRSCSMASIKRFQKSPSQISAIVKRLSQIHVASQMVSDFPVMTSLWQTVAKFGSQQQAPRFVVGCFEKFTEQFCFDAFCLSPTLLFRACVRRSLRTAEKTYYSYGPLNHASNFLVCHFCPPFRN